MEEEKYTLINTINGIEINEELMQKIQSVPERNENADVTINNYLIKQLGIDENQMSDDKKQLIQKNFIHLAVARMAKMESDGKFRIFIMIYNALLAVDFSDEKEINRKLIFELVANRNISPNSFWDVLKNPKQFKEEIEFYKQDDIQEGYVDLPTVVKTISDMVYQLPFWCEMVNALNTYEKNDEMNQFLLNMAKNYVKVLDKYCKNKCIEILTALK